jgi:hypothetical protein
MKISMGPTGIWKGTLRLETSVTYINLRVKVNNVRGFGDVSADVAARKAKDTLGAKGSERTGYPLNDALRAKKQAKRLARKAAGRKGNADASFVKRKAVGSHRRRPHF